MRGYGSLSVANQSIYFVEKCLEADQFSDRAEIKKLKPTNFLVAPRLKSRSRPTFWSCRDQKVEAVQGFGQIALLGAVFQLSFQLIQLLFEPALAGTHQPVVDEKDEGYERKRTEKIGVTHLLRQPV